MSPLFPLLHNCFLTYTAEILSLCKKSWVVRAFVPGQRSAHSHSSTCEMSQWWISSTGCQPPSRVSGTRLPRLQQHERVRKPTQLWELAEGDGQRQQCETLCHSRVISACTLLACLQREATSSPRESSFFFLLQTGPRTSPVVPVQFTLWTSLMTISLTSAVWGVLPNGGAISDFVPSLDNVLNSNKLIKQQKLLSKLKGLSPKKLAHGTFNEQLIKSAAVT